MFAYMVSFCITYAVFLSRIRIVASDIRSSVTRVMFSTSPAFALDVLELLLYIVRLVFVGITVSIRTFAESSVVSFEVKLLKSSYMVMENVALPFTSSCLIIIVVCTVSFWIIVSAILPIIVPSA